MSTTLDTNTLDAIDALTPDLFVRGYIQALFWTEEEELQGGVPELAPETVERIFADCNGFQKKAGNRIAAHPFSAGISFWLNRNHHGSGFWDYPEIWGRSGSRELDKLSHEFPPVEVYEGDDGRIYFF